MLDKPSASNSSSLAPMSLSVQVSFLRRYPIQFQIQGQLTPADLVLGLKAPVNSQSGMTLNLVEFDRSAGFLIEKFETLNFESRTRALLHLSQLWQRALGEWGLAFERVELQESDLRSSFSRRILPHSTTEALAASVAGVEDVLAFEIWRPWSEQGRIGHLYLGFDEEKYTGDLRHALQQFTGDWRSLIEEVGGMASLSELRFRDWKTGQQMIRSVSGRVKS